MLDLTNQAGIKYGQTANTQLGAVSDRLAQPVDFGSLGAAPQVNEQTRQAATQAILARMQPQRDQQRMALEARLANQGIAAGSTAYNRSFDEINRANTDAMLAADAQGGNEMARMYGLESSARDRAINEMVQQRQIPLNELAALLSGAQVQGPQFVPTPQGQIQPADIQGATYGSASLANNQYGQQMGQQTGNNQGLYGLLGTGAMAAAYKWSDRRLKENIRRIGTLDNGLPVYLFRYIWGGPEQIGLMADEVEQVNPGAVHSVNGLRMVNYQAAVA